MITLKLLVFACAIAALGAHYFPPPNDLYLGSQAYTYGESLLYRVTEWKYGAFFFDRDTIIDYPENGRDGMAYITRIYIKDNILDGTGGYPYVIDGGIGKRHAKIKLKSRNGRKFNFTVSIYGVY